MSGAAELGAWLEARGVARAVAEAWVAAQYGVDRAMAGVKLGSACSTLRVGDPAEDALVCEDRPSMDPIPRRALTLVVRANRPALVLDAGLGMMTLGGPETHFLDLALAFAPDGRSVELSERAPDGTTLVESLSHCLAEERFAIECEHKLAAHPDPESLVRERTAHGEKFERFDHCLLFRNKDGKIAAHRRSPDSHLSAPEQALRPGLASVLLRDCSRRNRPDAREDFPGPRAQAYFDKTCAQRGRYVWQGGRFVKVR